jgi:hypothetical protein
MTIWKKGTFYTPKVNPTIRTLKLDEEQVLRVYIAIIYQLVDEMEKSWNEMESNLKKQFFGKEYTRKWNILSRRAVKRNRHAFQIISRTAIADQLQWSRPRLYRILGPMVNNNILQRNRRGYLVPNIPFILEILDQKPEFNENLFWEEMGIELPQGEQVPP